MVCMIDVVNVWIMVVGSVDLDDMGDIGEIYVFGGNIRGEENGRFGLFEIFGVFGVDGLG